MASKPQLFGTDGVRGVAGSYPLDAETVWRLGRALGTVLVRTTAGHALEVVVGEDTRESSGWISRTFSAGLISQGARVVYAGVITTPGIAFLTRHHAFAAGVMVSASHNPYQDNGIKVFSRSGIKLCEAAEIEIEQEIEKTKASERAITQGDRRASSDLLADYVEFLCNLIPKENHVSGFRLVADCAHGAASRVAPEVFSRLGLSARILNAEPNGRNINLKCGSLYPEGMAANTKAYGADLGVAFDGDGDRAIFATRDGRVVDGDHILFAMAPFMKARGLLKGDAVVGTLMTNLGLELALARHGIALKRTAVGDKYVLEEMLRSGINLGGEPSGHIIFSDLSLAGGGILTLLQVLRLLAETGKPLSDLVRGLEQFPQKIRNVRVAEKLPLDSIPEVAHAIEEARHEFGGWGRVVVRYSGTESLARVMVETEDAEAVERHAARIAEAIQATIGSKER
jgi:phosphoglucosamine mutase